MNTIPPVLNPLIASSTDPTQVSNTIKGLILSFSSAIIMFAAVIFHWNINPSDLANYATGIGMFAGGIWFMYGIFHKIVATYGRATAPQP